MDTQLIEDKVVQYAETIKRETLPHDFEQYMKTHEGLEDFGKAEWNKQSSGIDMTVDAIKKLFTDRPLIFS